jgi:TatD DNase family protein
MKPDFIDIHAHVNFPEYDLDRDEVVKRAKGSNTWMINVGTDEESSKKAVELAEKYSEGVYAIIGLHPNDKEIFNKDFYKTLAKSPKVVGIGECGLDYFRSETEGDKVRQMEVFKAQIELSIEVNKPLMLHIRNAYGDAISVLKQYPKARGNVHFFAGNIAEAKEFIDLGFTLSFTGVITFAKEYIELVKFVSLDKILSETDCPYVTPAPHRGKRNEPFYVNEVVKKIAEIKGESLEKVQKQLVENARHLFGV